MTKPLAPETIAIIKATVPALEQYGSDITTAMYKRLFEDAEIAALFNQSNQKSGAQIHALAGAILAYAKNIENLAVLGSAVERIAQKHIGYAIHPEHYPYVARALLAAIQDVLGDAATPDILAAWGEAFWSLAAILTAREAQIREEIEAQPGGWRDWRRFVIVDRRAESDTIMSFTLRPADGNKVIPHRPGQYLTFRFDAIGWAGVKRNFTISCGPNDDHYRITVKREPEGEASVFLHDKARVGTVLEATPPAGEFYLPPDQKRPVVLLSGGVGLTPMVSMVEAIASRHPDLPAYYIHGTTNRGTHALDTQMRHLARSHGNISVSTFYEQNDPSSGANDGLITLDWLKANTPLAEADVYLCGPKPFLRHFVAALEGEGVPADRIHYEFFGPADETLAA